MSATPTQSYWRTARGALILLMGCLAIGAPFFVGTFTLTLVGVLLFVCGSLEVLQTFTTDDDRARRSTYLSGGLSVLAGLLILARPILVLTAMTLFLAGSFVLDGVNRTIAAWRARKAGTAWAWSLVTGLVNVVLAVLLGIQWPLPGLYAVGILVGLRLVASGWAILVTREAPPVAQPGKLELHPDRRLRLRPHPEVARLQAELETREAGRRGVDVSWCLVFLVTFFAIHVGRMAVEWTGLGMVAPLAAVLGDVGTALFIAFGLILPCRLTWRALTRPLERRGWERLLKRADEERGPGLSGRLTRWWLMHRLGFAWRMRQARFSPRAALRWGLSAGLPLTAVLIALNPIWGFSWYFNSENWATGIWDHWAESRTDYWRQEMVLAVREHYRAAGVPDERLFQVEPAGVAGAADFSFLVLGDTGEGDPSQFCLKDRFLELGGRPDVKFLVISSDVIYPAGAMIDYEPKFYLPFKGFTKPVYAIPGNHDWYDALEAFNANFLEADAARVSMRARVVADLRLTTTTDRRIDTLIDEAARLRREYGVPTGWQRGPFFEMQTERFALIAVDTGVARTMDAAQRAWLEAALERARGKFRFVILGHPLYAGGRYQGTDDESFAAIHRLLQEHQVEAVMAGDTHYLEYYRETYPAGSATSVMHHFINGGGGAYLSIGTALDWPKQTPVADCAFYPRTDAIVAKLDRETPGWKRPLWFWVKHLNAWPSSAEAMASAFDFNKAPFYQSFYEIRVEGSANVIRLRPHSANGRLRWRDLQTYGQVVPAGQNADDPVEFVLPLPAGAKGR